MIHDVDAALRALIERDALQGTDVEVLFDAPTKDWASRRNSPTVDVYLYDIREDLARREHGRVDVRGADRIVTDRRRPPRWMKLSYLVTAWTQRPEDEHRLLSSLLHALLRLDVVPPDVVAGALGDLGLPLGLTVAVPPPEDRALSDTWSALGGDLKPSLDVVVTMPIDLARPIHVGPPVLEETRLRLGGERAQRHRRGTDDALPPAGATRTPADDLVSAGTTAAGRWVRLRELTDDGP